MTTIKRSMAVFPCPIVAENAHHHRAPRDDDAGWTRVYYDYNDPTRGHYNTKWNGTWGYKIKRVTNSTDYKPGWHLSKEVVDRLISEGWTVSVLSKV